MKYKYSDADYDYYLDYFQGNEVWFMMDKTTKQLKVSSESVALVLGYNSMSEMLNSNENIQDIFFDGLKNGDVIKLNDDE